MSLSKGKCLIILPTDHKQERSLTLTIQDLIVIIKQLENDDITIKFVTYHGEKPYLNFDNSSMHKDFIDAHDELLSTVSNIDNVVPDNFDAVIIPSYVYIYEEIKIEDYSIVKLIENFYKKNKKIMAYEHSVYVLCKCVEEMYWPFIGYSMTGFSIKNAIKMELNVPICEEEIMLLGGNYVGKERQSEEDNGNNEVVVCDKNIITGYDRNSLKLCLGCLKEKIKL